MRNSLNMYISAFRQDRQKQIKFALILAALAVVVAGVVAWQLHSTGVAMSNEVYCGQEEHVHDVNCYETALVCGLDESEGHVHDDSCYEAVETLICTDDSGDHVHTDDCYETTQELICGLEETGGHTHTDDCYETTLVCGIPEHTHTVECLIDETADVETADDWEATLPEKLSGVWADDVVAVAESQLDYAESAANFQLAEDGETRQGYTRYGAWYGNEYGDWDAMFASFCLNYAGVPEEDFPEASGSYSWITELEDLDLYMPSDELTAQYGDLIFLDTDGDGGADSVGIVKEIREDADFVVNEESGETVTTTVVAVIEGDSGDAVRENEYRADDAAIVGYGMLPEQTAAEFIADFQESSVDEDYDDGILTGGKNFLYEDDDLVLKVNVAGSVEIPESAAAADETENEDTAAPSWENMTMEVAMTGENNEAYEQMLAYAGEQEGELYRLFNVDLAFFYSEYEVDVSGCDITVDAAPTQALLNAAVPEEPEDADVELGVTVALLEAREEEVVELDSANVTSENPEDAALSADLSGSDFGIMLLDDADPHFTVQFYANIDQILKQPKEGDTDLTVIETHTEDNGAVLPTNNGTTSASAYNTSVVELVSDGSGGFKLDSEKVLTEMYEEEAYEFVLEPDLHSMNKLEVNSDYTLKQIWVLKDEKDDKSEDESDWDIYNVTSTQDPATGEYSYNISFTNNSSEASDTTIYIKEGSVFRFVYDPTPSNAYVTANMYDYNIGDGYTYASASTSGGLWSSGRKYMYTAEQGINSASNYTGTGTKLGFGNNNTGSGLNTLTWTNNGYDNELNKYNNQGLLGCTFSLVTGLDADGHIVYNSGVIAPKLFNEGEATGKQTYSNAQLTFDREGDTYTITAISGNDNISATKLDTFVNPGGYTNIFTNNFWPMDGVSTDGRDFNFGGDVSNQYYFGNATTALPASDDGTDHNSYFGMNFDIEFSYTNDYIGPLEYFFFGDDDMWVFLDGELILDIGGVHSSVGEHVDLWDYLESKRESLPDGETAYHTLSVFYTERGASGSTCYISYTLPTVSSVTPVDDSGSLRVDKVVEGATAGTGEEFTFTLELKDENGNDLTNLYNSIVYTDEAENEVENSYLLTSGGTFTLRDGWHIVIHNLPAGTVATVTETSRGGYSTTWTVDSAEPVSGTVATSNQITDGGLTTIVFTNTAAAELPNAGGSGIWIYTAAGVCLTGGAAVTLAARKRRTMRA